MTLNERIIAALKGFGDPVVPNLYAGSAERYYTFNYVLLPAQFADGRPVYFRALIQVHLFCPLFFDPVERCAQTVLALAGAGLGWSEVEQLTEEDTQHLVFECEGLVACPSDHGNEKG